MQAEMADILYLILIFLASILSVLSLASGILLVVQSYLNFKSYVNRSMNMDIEIVRVAKREKKPEEQGGESWKEEIRSMEQLLTSLSNIRESSAFRRFFYGGPVIALELVNPASSEEIFFYVVVPKKYRAAAEKQIHSYFPDSSIEKVPDYTIFYPGSFTSTAVLQLKKKYALPVKTFESMNADPLNEISNALSKLETVKEGAALQIVLQPAEKGWNKMGKSIAHSMQQGKQLKDAHTDSLMKDVGKSLKKEAMGTLFKPPGAGKDAAAPPTSVQLTPEEQEVVKAIERKSSKAGFQVNIRLIASAETPEKADEILSHMENSFSQFEMSDVNHFLVKSRAKSRNVAFDYIFRNFNAESAMILNTEEIASIFHFPISTTATPKIKWLKSGAAPPPIGIPNQGVLVGFNEYRGMKTDIRLAEGDRRRHFYTIGQTGTGKTTILQEMAKQDAREGNGFCFIDPHGDAIEDILACIPKERAEDVIVFDPTDVERPFGLNMLEYDESNPQTKTFVINEMIGIFDQLYDLKATGGPMFEQYMRNAMLLIMDDPESGSTLMEISKVLADEDFRKMKLSKCKNPIVVDFWTNEAEKAGGEAALANMVPYITSKLTTFISNDMMRPIIAQQNSTINMREIMDNKKILLIKLSKGKIGEINARLLGMVIVGKLLMAALSRTDMAENDRVDFHLYLDEFQNVTTNSISQILSEARKYRLCLYIAHQFIAQLKEEISKAVFGNIGSMVLYRVGSEDAEFLEKQVEPIFTRSDLVNVDNYKGFAKILINGVLTKPFSIQGFPPTKGDQEIANYFKELSRLKYGRDRAIVDQEILGRGKIANKL